jgi:hypothetical protein
MYNTITLNTKKHKLFIELRKFLEAIFLLPNNNINLFILYFFSHIHSHLSTILQISILFFSRINVSIRTVEYETTGKNHSYLSTQSWSTVHRPRYSFPSSNKYIQQFLEKTFFFDAHSLDTFMFGFSVIFSFSPSLTLTQLSHCVHSVFSLVFSFLGGNIKKKLAFEKNVDMRSGLRIR